MEKIVFSSFASERDSGFRICTQITEREGKKTVRKTALNEAGKPHVRKLKKNEEGLIRTYKDVPFFRVCPVTDQ